MRDQMHPVSVQYTISVLINFKSSKSTKTEFTIFWYGKYLEKGSLSLSIETKIGKMGDGECWKLQAGYMSIGQHCAH